MASAGTIAAAALVDVPSASSMLGEGDPGRWKHPAAGLSSEGRAPAAPQPDLKDFA